MRILILFLFLLAILIFAFILTIKKTQKGSTTSTATAPTPSTSKNIVVAETYPKDGQKNVYPGEIMIWFSTQDLVGSRNDFSFSITPQPPYSIKPVSIYPTQKIEYQVLGGLLVDTTYTVSIKNTNGITIKTFSFTTSSTPPESSSKYVTELQDKITEKYYPLFYFVPYYNDDFHIDYTGRLSLQVKIKKNKVDNIKKEVLEWIKNKGVDPSTHKIQYINVF